MKTRFKIIQMSAVLMAMTFFTTKIMAQQTILGTTNINAIIEEAPGVPNSLEAAAKRAFGSNPLQPDMQAMDNFYLPYENKVNHKMEEYQQYAERKMSATGSVNDYHAQAIQDINSNPIIANMGGYEKISQMSEEEAKVAATQAAAQFVADPFAANGNQSAGMSALYQKVLNDPAYAKQFEKMSEAEKEAELRKFMANDQVVAKTPAEMQQQHWPSGQQQSEADKIRNAQEIQLKIVEWQQQLTEVAQLFGEAIHDIEQSGLTHDAIQDEFRKKFAAIPEIVMGEGREKDPALSHPLYIETAEKHRTRAAQELKEYGIAMAELSSRYQSIVSGYLDYLEENKEKVYGGVSAADIMHSYNTEIPLVSLESSLVGIGLELSKWSREFTGKCASWEQNYLQTIQNYQQ
jgi:hypothetical protein